jgi:uncharacterized repeat protein (TIGR01451 family)
MHISECLRTSFVGVVLTLACSITGTVHAQDNLQSTTAGLAIETIAERRVVTPSSEGAQVKFVAADQLQIGDEIFYTVRVRNVTNTPLDDVIVVKPMPRNTQYVADSAVGPAATIGVSIDGGATFAAPDKLEIVTMPGVTRPALPSDFTHIRWQLQHPLAAGATALLRFRGIFQ